MAALEHPHVSQCFGGDFTEQGPYFIWQQLVGKPLTECFDETGLTVAIPTIEVVQQIGAALHAMRETGLPREVQPDMIYVTPEGETTLFPFDLARTFLDDRLLADPVALGDLTYASPELLMDKYLVPASDVFSLATLSHQILTGRLPFVVHRSGRIDAKIMNADPEIAPHADPQVQKYWKAVFKQALEKNPNHRFNDIPAFMNALGEVCRLDGFAKGFAFDGETAPSFATIAPISPSGTLVFPDEMLRTIRQQLTGEIPLDNPLEEDEADTANDGAENQVDPNDLAEPEETEPEEDNEGDLEQKGGPSQAKTDDGREQRLGTLILPPKNVPPPERESAPEAVLDPASVVPKTPLPVPEPTPGSAQDPSENAETPEAVQPDGDIYTPFDHRVLTEEAKPDFPEQERKPAPKKGKKSLQELLTGKAPDPPKPEEPKEEATPYQPITTPLPLPMPDSSAGTEETPAKAPLPLPVPDAGEDSPPHNAKANRDPGERAEVAAPIKPSQTDPRKTEATPTPSPQPTPAVKTTTAEKGAPAKQAPSSNKKTKKSKTSKKERRAAKSKKAIKNNPEDTPTVKLVSRQSGGDHPPKEATPDPQKAKTSQKTPGPTISEEPQQETDKPSNQEAPPKKAPTAPTPINKENEGHPRANEQAETHKAAAPPAATPKKSNSLPAVAVVAALAVIGILLFVFQNQPEPEPEPEAPIIPSVAFEDPAMEILLAKRFDTNHNSGLEATELEAVKQLSIPADSEVRSFQDLNLLPNLSKLTLAGLKLTDLPNLPATLTELDLANNQLTGTLDFSAFPKLKHLVLSGNEIAGFPILPPNLDTLDLRENLLEEDTCPDLNTFNGDLQYNPQWQGRNLDCSKPPVTVIEIPDPALKQALLTATDKDGDGTITQEEALAVNELNLGGKPKRRGSVADLTGLAAFRNLRHLDVSFQKLKNLNELPPRLQSLIGTGNQLSKLPLPKLQTLKTLHLANNRFKRLNLGSLRNLEDLVCSRNPLEVWPTFPSRLKRFFASNVPLAEPPDLSTQADLHVAVLKFNDFETLPLIGLNLSRLDVTGNQLTTAVCETIWDYEQRLEQFTYRDQRGANLDCTDEQAVAIADPALHAHLLATYDDNGDGRFSRKEAATVTKLKTPGKGKIRDLTGLVFLPNLTELDCRKEQVSALPELPTPLHTLRLDQNQFADLPGNLPLHLKKISFEGNQLDAEDCGAVRSLFRHHSRASISFLEQNEMLLFDCLLDPVPDTPTSVHLYGDELAALLSDGRVSKQQIINYLSDGAIRVPIKDFQKPLTAAAQQFPDQPAILAALAKQNLIAENYQKATELYRKALQDQSVPRAHFLFAAYAALQAGNKKQADTWYQEEAKLRRKFGLKDTFVRNGWVAGSSGKFEISRNFTRKIKDHQREVEKRNTLASRIALLRFAFLEGDWRRFKTELSALKREPMDLNAWRIVAAWDLVETGSFREAFLLLEDNPSTEAMMLRGYLHLVSGQEDRAIPILRSLDSAEFPEVNSFPALTVR